MLGVEPTIIKLNTRVVRDNTGATVELPMLFISEARKLVPVEPLLAYLLEQCLAQSTQSQVKMCQAVALLLNYMAANRDVFDVPNDLYASFGNAVWHGTVDDNGNDPSGLYWIGKSVDNSKQILRRITAFSSWMYQNGYAAKQINPWRDATSYEQYLYRSASYYKSKESLLGHLSKAGGPSDASNRARTVLLPVTSKGYASTKVFPDTALSELLWNGFMVPGKTLADPINERYKWRDICITLLLNGGGLRVSEPFHIWVGDVIPSPEDANYPIVRVYHPIEGKPPQTNRFDNKKYPTRASYLKHVYPGYFPRTTCISGNYRAGWKNPRLDNDVEKYINVFWFPREMGCLFLQCYRIYMHQRVMAGVRSDKHPFLWVSSSEKEFGQPYTISSYNESLKKATERIGLTYSKMNGTTPHGHRHAYGLRLETAGSDAIITQRGLHHRSIESQQRYKEYTIRAVTTEMERALCSINGLKLPDNSNES